MARVLVLFGTRDGHTATIAAAIGNALNDLGIDADVVQAGTVDPSITRHDGVIVTAPIRAGAFPKPVIACVRRHAAEISARPNAFVPVCLAVLERNNSKVAADLDAIVRRFAESTGWTPASIRFVAGALLYTRYNILTRWVMKRVAAKAGGDTDTRRDYTYTDWNDVKAFAMEFASRLRAVAA